MSADDIARGCYIDFDDRTLHRIASGSNITREMCVRLGMDSSEGYLKSDLKQPGRGGAPLLSQTEITDGEWHRIGFVWDGSYRHLYVDEGEVATDDVPLSGLKSLGGGLYFGAGGNLSSDTFFSGLIDDVRIYNRAVIP
jgi:hypothetical protein